MDTRSFYNKVAWIYPLSGLYFSRYKKYIQDILLHEPRQVNILDIGAVLQKEFLIQTRHTVHGLDFSDRMTRSKQQYYSEFYCEDVHNIDQLGLTAQYDYIIMGFIISVLSDREQIFEKLRYLMAGQGRILILNHFIPDHSGKSLFFPFGKCFGRIMRFEYGFRVKDCNFTDLFDCIHAKDLNGSHTVKCLSLSHKKNRKCPEEMY